MILEFRIVVTLGVGRLSGRVHEGLLRSDNVLFLELNTSHTAHLICENSSGYKRMIFTLFYV